MLSKIKLHNIFEAIYFENFACLYLIIPIKSIPWYCSGNILTIDSEFNKRELHRASAWFLSCGWTENLNNFVFTHAADDYALQTRSFEIANRVNILVSQYYGDKTFVDRPFHYYRLRPEQHWANCTERGVLCVLRFSTPSHQLTFYWRERKFYWCCTMMSMWVDFAIRIKLLVRKGEITLR